MTRDEIGTVAILIAFMFCMLVVMSGCGELNGRDAAPCTVSSDATGAFITCPDGTSTFVRNGQNGVDGQDGSTITWVDPCPTLVVPFPELLALIDGSYYAVYASGTKIHLARLTPGTYSTTDGRSCTFVIGSNGELQ